MARVRGDLNPHLEPHRLSHFLTVLEEGGFSRAARVCGMTQQALSKSIAKLEGALEVKLFERTALGVAATPYAEHLAIRARIIIAEARLAAAEIEALRGFRSGLVRLGVGPSLAVRLAPKVVAAFRARLPDVGISLSVGNTQTLAPMLARGQLDLLLSAPPPAVEPDPDLQIESFGLEVDRIVGRADHPLRSKADASVADFARCTWVGESTANNVLARVSEICIRHGVEPPIDVISADSVDIVKGLLIETDALCLLSSQFYLVEAQAGLLAPFARPEFELARTIRLHQRRRGRLTPAARLMREMLRDHLSIHHAAT